MDALQVLTLIIGGVSVKEAFLKYEAGIGDGTRFIQTWCKAMSSGSCDEKRKRSLIIMMKRLVDGDKLNVLNMLCQQVWDIAKVDQPIRSKDKLIIAKLLLSWLKEDKKSDLAHSIATSCTKYIIPSMRYRADIKPTLLSLVYSDIFVISIDILCHHPDELWDTRQDVITFVQILIGWSTTANPSSFQNLYLTCIKDLLKSIEKIVISSYESAPSTLAAHLSCSADGLMSSLGDVDDVCHEMDLLCSEMRHIARESDTDKELLELCQHMNVRRMCMILGRLDTGAREKVFEAKSQVILNALASTGTAENVLGSALLSLVVEFATQGASDTNSTNKLNTYESLMHMVTTEEGETPGAVINVLARGVCAYENELLPQLLGSLAAIHTPVKIKRAVLRVIREYARNCNFHSASCVDQLVNRLVDVLENTKAHELRKEAGEALACVPPHIVIPLLSQTILHPDPQSATENAYVRSSCIEALAAYVENFKQLDELLRMWLNEMEACIDPKETNRLLDAAKVWRIPWHHQALVTSSLLGWILENPSKPGPVGLFRRLVDNQSLTEFDASLQELVLPKILNRAPLTESELTNSTTEQLSTMIFSRLAPLLALRMMPFNALVPYADLISVATCRHIAAMFEFNEIRQQACEVIARLPLETHVWPIMCWLSNQSASCCPPFLRDVALENRPISITKASVYIACHAIVSRGLKEIPIACMEFVSEAMGSSKFDSSEQDAKKSLVDGFSHLLGLLVTSNMVPWSSRKKSSLIQPVDDDCDSVRQDVNCCMVVFGPDGRAWLLEQLQSKNARVAVIVANSLTLCIRSLACRSGLIESQAQERRDDDTLKVIDTILDTGTMSTIIEAAIANNLFPSFLQLVFTTSMIRVKLVGDTREAPLTSVQARRLVQITLEGLEQQDEGTRTWSLKLLGVILTIPDEYKVIPDGTTGKFISILRGLVNMESSPAIRALADQLLSNAFS